MPPTFWNWKPKIWHLQQRVADEQDKIGNLIWGESRWLPEEVEKPPPEPLEPPEGAITRAEITGEGLPTKEFQPRGEWQTPQPWWIKPAYYGLKGLQYALYPFTATGMAAWELGKAVPSEEALRRLEEEPALQGKVPPEMWREVIKRRKEIGAPKFRLDQPIPWGEYLPSGERYREFRELPLIEQIGYEAPALAALMAAPSAMALRAGLASAAARPGLPAIIPEAARLVLAPLAGMERIIGFLPSKVAERIARVRWTRAQQSALAKLDVEAQEVVGRELGNILTESPELAMRATPETISRIAGGMADILKVSPQSAVIAPRYGLTGLSPSQVIGSPFAIESARAYARFVLQWASPTKPAWAVEALKGVGYTTEAIRGMTLETAWVNITKSLGTDAAIVRLIEAGIPEVAVAPPVEPEVVRPIPEAVPEPLIPPRAVEEVAVELEQVSAEIEGITEYLATEPATKLTDLIKRTGWYKGEVSNLTLKQYRDLTGKTIIPPSILTPDKKHVRWEYSLDDAATQMGYPSGEALKEAIETTGEASISLRALTSQRTHLGGELREMIEAEAVKLPSLTTQIKSIYSEIEIEVKAAQAGIKGLKGEEAGVARQTLKLLQKELDSLFKMLEAVPPTRIGKLRQTIMAFVRFKGLPEPQYRKLFADTTGRRSLRIMTEAQLESVLVQVRRVRPTIIRQKAVITAKTEAKVQSLKDTLTAREQMTEKDFTRIMGELNIDTPRFISQYRFATEKQGKALIQAMLDDAEWIGIRIKIATALDKQPEIATRIDQLATRIRAEKRITINGEPIIKVSPLQDIRYYVMSIEAQTGAPFYQVWQLLNNKHLENQYRIQQTFDRLEKATPAYKAIAGDDIALKRVSNYIASKHKLGPKAPTDITTEEIKLANEIEAILAEFRNTVRLAKFEEGYELYPDNIQRIKEEIIPDAPAGDLRKAIDIYEGRGRDALIDFLNTRDWGIIKSGYEPLSVVNPRIYLRRVRPQTVGKGHIQVRRGIQYAAEDRHILSRLNSYTKQMSNLTELSPAIRKFLRVFDENADLLRNVTGIGENLGKAINELKGYSEVGGPFGRVLLRLYSQTMAAVFWDPFKWLRNKCQNFAFHPDRARWFMPRYHKALTEQDLIYFNAYVSQKLGLKRDYLMRGFKAFPGFVRLTRLANQTSLYPWTDESNRMESYMMRKNRVLEALEEYNRDKNIGRLISKSGLEDLEPLQQIEALEFLAQETVEYPIEGLEAVSGQEAFARSNAREVTNNTHFMYERSQRAPAEMGAIGRILGNLFVFPRSYAQRIIFQGRKLRPGSRASGAEKRYALQVVLGIIICGLLIGETFKRVTGRKYNPYNPINILSWAPGGLTIGAAEEISSALYDIGRAAFGDEDALNRVTASLPRAARLLIPFYRPLILMLETATDKKNLDRYALRKLRALIDKEYTPRESAYKMERDHLVWVQHILFGGEAPEGVVKPMPKFEPILPSEIEKPGQGLITPEEIQALP